MQYRLVDEPVNSCIIIIIFMPTSTKWQAWKLKVKQNNDHGVLIGVKCAHEGDHISPLERYRQLLKQEHCFSHVPGDRSNASA